MKRMLLLLLAFIVAAFTLNQTPEDRARKLIAKMTLEEKAALMRHDDGGVERLGIRPYNWWNEALHGVARNGKATTFP